MKSTQDFIHWLEQGAGARGLRAAVLVVAALALTVVFSWKQFHGPPNEWTLQQVELGRQLAQGHGFTTRVNYPQTYAVMKARGVPLSETRLYPELHHAPLYPLVLAAVFKLAPASLWQHVPAPPNGWAPDYVVLAVNLALFWLAIGLTWRLARRLFDERVAWLAALGAAVSVTLWQQTVVVSGLPLLTVLVLAVFLVLAGAEEAWGEFPERGVGLFARVAALGALGALLFLAEYSAGLVWLVLAGYLAWRVRGVARWPALGIFFGVALLLVTPWLTRNVAVAGHPLGLAWQNLALKADDITALPSAARNTASVEAIGLDLKKLGNKGLTGMERNLKERIWSGGGLLFTAFFVAGLAYQFRHGPTNRVRWCFAVTLLVLLAAQPFFNSGESPRLPAYYLAPLLIVFGAGFFAVLVSSQTPLAPHWRWVVGLLLAVQALPLVRDCLEPRKVHFYYPPYFPNLFMELRRDSEARFQRGVAVASDVPAGTAWYGQQRVWSKPERLRDFYEITVQQPIGALLLTPVTLDRPFFTELAARREDAIRTLSDTGGWGPVYAGLVTRRMPANFPLNGTPQRLTENMVLLVDPGAFRPRGN
ncbi:MAG: hypothetical protein HYV96_02505 [Opitutae bacterium]|nr:hypothetical protein [Opitutae bacterium]